MVLVLMTPGPAMHALFALALWLMTFSAASAQSAVEAWVRRYSHPVDSEDQARKVATDSAGNVIVVGYTDEGVAGADFLIIKYSGAGVPLWTSRYNGPVNLDDQATAVAVDSSDNVFVTGFSQGASGTPDYATVAYSGAGAPLWTNRYNGPGNSDDEAQGVAVDASGKVFVTGSSTGGSGFRDYATVAYSGAGVPLWTNRYNGPANNHDEPTGIVVDGNGNVVVSGSVTTSNFSSDYATVAYSGAGVPLWTNRYNGPADDADGANALAVDGSGNVFVTGASWTGGGYEYATVAYSGAGAPLWTNRFSRPGDDWDIASAVAVDRSGNVVVAGRASGNVNAFATVAYSGAGVPMWTNTYTATVDDGATAMAMDASGNVVVTGYSMGSGGLYYDYVTVAYSGSGVPLWTNRYDGPAHGDDMPFGVAVDGSGNAFVTGISSSGSSAHDIVTVAYSAAGIPLWTNRYSGTANRDDLASAVAVSGSGNVFVTGFATTGDFYPDYATVAYSGAGVPLWTNRYGAANMEDVATAMAVDANGNVFVTGRSFTPNSSQDYATVKYSGAGVPLWTNRYNGPAPSSSDIPAAMAVDSGGNVIVSGSSIGPGTVDDYATVKYSGAGVPLWTNRYNGPRNGSDIVAAVAVDGNGNVFVTGSSYDNGGYTDYATVAYSATGLPLWVNRYEGPAHYYDSANAVAVDSSGKVYVTGSSASLSFDDDYTTIAYSGAGVPLWTNRYNGPGNGHDRPSAMALDGNGNVFVTGSAQTIDGYRDYATVAYSSTGVPLWTNRYDGPGHNNDHAYAVAVDGSGNVIVTGQSTGSGSSWDYATVAYSGAGIPLWTNRYNGPANGPDFPLVKSCLAIGPDGAVYVTGASDAHYSATRATYDYTTIKYVSTTSPLIRLNSQVVGNQLVLSWTNAAFGLQSAPFVQGTYSTIPGATSPYTTPFSGTQRYFRLKAN